MSPSGASFIGKNGKMLAASKAEKLAKKAAKDAWKAAQKGYSSQDYSELNQGIASEMRDKFFREAAEKNGWSVEEEKEWQRSLKEEQRENQRLAAKMKKEQEAASQNQALGSMMGGLQQNAMNESPVPQNPDGSFELNRDKQEELQREKQDRQENIERVKEETAEKEAELKEEEDAELAKEDGSKPLPIHIALFANPIFFIFLMVVDSLLALIPVVGDFLGFAVMAIAWSIPCIMMFDMKTYFVILQFLLFDMVFGLVAGSLGNVIPGVGDSLIDAVPEIVLMLSSFMGGKK